MRVDYLCNFFAFREDGASDVGLGGGRSCFCLALVGGVLLSSTVGSEPSPLAISTQGVMVVCGAGLAKELD